MRKGMIIGALALVGSLASPAFAKDQYSGVRLGVSLGQETFDSKVSYLGFGTEKVNTNRMGYTITGGWALNKWFAVEGAYNDGGDFNKTLFVDMDNFPLRDISSHYTMKAFVGSVVGSWWINPKLGVYGRAGVYGWNGTYSFAYDNNVRVAPGYQRQHYDDDGFEPLVGLGVQTELDGAIVRLEYSMATLSDHTETFAAARDATVSTLSLGLVWTIH
jgi:hypothetical protein